MINKIGNKSYEFIYTKKSACRSLVVYSCLTSLLQKCLGMCTGTDINIYYRSLIFTHPSIIEILRSPAYSLDVGTASYHLITIFPDQLHIYNNENLWQFENYADNKSRCKEVFPWKEWYWRKTIVTILKSNYYFQVYLCRYLMGLMRPQITWPLSISCNLSNLYHNYSCICDLNLITNTKERVNQQMTNTD